MKTYRFTIIAAGLDPDADAFEDHFFETGCDDATISVVKGSIVLDFERDANSLLQALASAIRDIRKAGATVVRIEPHHLASPSDIAGRTGSTQPAGESDEAEYDVAKARLAAGVDELVPKAVADRLIDGAPPLRVWREHRRMTLAELARASGVTQPMISRIETGKRTGDVATLRRLADALGILVDDLAA